LIAILCTKNIFCVFIRLIYLSWRFADFNWTKVYHDPGLNVSTSAHSFFSLITHSLTHSPTHIMEKEYPGPVSQPTLLQQAQRAEEQWGLLYTLLVQSDSECVSECVSECDSSSGSAMHTQTSWRVIPLTPSHTHSHRSTRECESRIIYGSFWEFSQWMSGVESSCYHSFTVNSASERVTECFHSIPSHACRSVAVYADYKYFHELFCGEKRLVSERQALWLLPHRHSLTASHHHSLTASSNTALSDHSHTHSLTASTSPVLLMDWGLPRVAACKDKYSSLVPQEMGPEASTLWLGTRGAHTPLHYGE
jgi:hypothetical protein